MYNYGSRLYLFGPNISLPKPLDVYQVRLSSCSPTPSPDTLAIDAPLMRTRGIQQTVRT